MRKSVACSVPYASGGLGLHFTQIVEDARSQGNLAHYYTPRIQDGDSSGRSINSKFSKYLKYTPVRQSPGWRNYFDGDLFDRAVASQMIASEEFEGFGGQSLHSFRKARQLGCQSLTLMAANSHVDNVTRQHRKAIEQFGLETSWLNETQRLKTNREYQEADFIEVGSDYTKKTFLEAGFPESKLLKKIFEIHPRFIQQPYVEDDVFQIVYTGSVTVMKGVPILLEAFSRFSDPKARLVLVGGWATRGMRRYMQSWLAKDPRIQVSPGDPLPHLRKADVCVHPSYEDGFAYAPMEALACGVPVIVTEDTGMKEHVVEGKNGYIVSTGNWEEVLERLVACQKRNLRGELA
jgi:glycosyltransferase involved in cell wall biosynthesis